MTSFNIRVQQLIRQYETTRSPLPESIGAARLVCLKNIIEACNRQNVGEDITKLAVFAFFYADPHRMSGSLLLHLLRTELAEAMAIIEPWLDPLNMGTPPGTFECYNDRALKECFDAFSPEQKQAAKALCQEVLPLTKREVTAHYKTSKLLLWFLDLIYNVFKVDFLKGRGIGLSAERKHDLEKYTKVHQDAHRKDHAYNLGSMSLFRTLPSQDEPSSSTNSTTIKPQ